MRSETINVTVRVNNLPDAKKAGFMVVRQGARELWYYGTYETEDKAKEVALEIGNGLYFEVR